MQTELNQKTKRRFVNPFKSYSKKTIIIISSIMALVVALAIAIPLIVGYVKGRDPLELPEEYLVEVISYDNKIYLEVPEVEGAVLYYFEINFGGGEPFVLQSNLPRVDATGIMSNLGSYILRSYCIGEYESTLSQISESVNYDHKMQIESPEIFFDEETQNVYWNYVESAASYRLYFGDEILYLNYNYVENELNRGSFRPTLNNGEYTIVMVAIPSATDTYLLPSENSNTLQITLTTKKPTPIGASYSIINQTVTLSTSNILTMETYVIMVNDQEYLYTATAIQEVYLVNLSIFGANVLKVGDEVKVYVKGNENNYILDSDYVVAVSQ